MAASWRRERAGMLGSAVRMLVWAEWAGLGAEAVRRVMEWGSVSSRTRPAGTGRRRGHRREALVGMGSASAGSKAGVWSRKSPWGGPRAGEMGGGRWGSSRWRRIADTTGGSVRNARIVIVPPRPRLARCPGRGAGAPHRCVRGARPNGCGRSLLGGWARRAPRRMAVGEGPGCRRRGRRLGKAVEEPGVR